ncbi:unnamed protein product, partial [Brugia pahangi]|uniref:Uncharacterized protein n=1 Tax=Brugia pahangi TaxID=6280 RepID=A0A0N4TW02_BRUPA
MARRHLLFVYIIFCSSNNAPMRQANQEAVGDGGAAIEDENMNAGMMGGDAGGGGGDAGGGGGDAGGGGMMGGG